MTVLLVDDSLVVLFVFTSFLKRSGMEVVTALNGAEALLCLHAELPDVVVTDLDMPVMGGVELCRTLRAQARTKHLPVVAVTSGNAGDDALKAGCNAVLYKPLESAQLVETIHRVAARC